jgi:hypothetical protein
MSETLAPTVFTHRGETTPEDTVVQAHRIEASVWQTLVRERQQRILMLGTPVQISHVSLTHPDKDHTDTFQDFRNALVHGLLPSNYLLILDTIGESFRKLAENLSNIRASILVASTRATSETSSLVSPREAVHYSITPRASSELEWTEEKNQRRCYLVDKEIDGTISPVEKVELTQLQNEMLAYRRKVAPLPLEALRELHQELLRKAGDKMTE